VSDFRDKIQLARTEYLTARYPGNLAVDILWNGNALIPTERHELPPAVPRWKILLGSGLGLTGVAAVIAIFISLERTPRNTIRATPRPQRVHATAVLAIPERPPTPENVRLVPPMRRISTLGPIGAFPPKPTMTKPQMTKPRAQQL
jgi:hypothetical protein